MKRPIRMPEFKTAAPTPERMLKAANDNDLLEGVVRLSDWPIARLLHGKRIDREEAAAGERLAELHHFAGMAPLGAFDYGRPKVDGGTGGNVIDGRFAAKARYRSHVDAMGDLGRLVVAVSCENHMPAESQIVPLRIGLRRLAEFIGLVTRAA